MLSNYFKIAFRNLVRNKIYSLINILGLSLGVGCCLLLTLYVQDEFSYDTHHKDKDNIYRIITHFTNEDGGEGRMATTSPPIALTMRDELPEITSAARVLNPPGVTRNLIKYEDKLFYETNGFISDSSVFEIFSYDLIEGNPEKALVETNSIVISSSLSKKLFDNESALNRIISVSQGGEAINYKVTGVFKELGKSFLEANFFTSMTSDGFARWLRTDPGTVNQWGGQNFLPAYVKLAPGSDVNNVTKKMNEVLMRYGAKDIAAMGRKKTLTLEPVKDIYLRSDVGQNPRIVYTYVIVTIAVFILLIACINFMNLSTAKATKRASEIGIRKVMGAFRSSLVRQILGEAVIIVTISLLISIVFAQIAMPLFNELTGKTISFESQNVFFLIASLAGIAIVTGFLAGIYPAFYLSSFQPAEVLKGKFTMKNSSGWLRRSLVVFQFLIAITLGCGMIIISDQLQFMQEKDLGFEGNARIVLPLRTEAARKSYSSLKKDLQNINSVKDVSATDYIPGDVIWSDNFFYPDGGNMESAIDINRTTVDYRYVELLGLKLIAGRSFTDNLELESQSKILLNREAVKQLGYAPEEIVGRHIYNDWQGVKYTHEVIGVVEDYHQMGLQQQIRPILIQVTKKTDEFSYVVMNVNDTNFRNTIEQIESQWKKATNDTPFEFSFIDENIQKQYNDDRKVSSIITSFTFIAMLISCLGLYGLSSYMAERKFKEIGVRKVMGASVVQIVALMSTEFIKLVGAAFILSVPISWYTMNRWLDGFAYKTLISPFVFAGVGTVALAIALLTISFESIKAASTNPINSLRNE